MNTIIIIAILAILSSLLFGNKKQSNTLYCGIFGFLGLNPNDFNMDKFNILGLFNDERGKDACGIFMNKKVHHFGDDNKLYQKAVINGVIPKERNKMSAVLGHCRKASVGGVCLTKAQPIFIKNENDEIVFVMIHNGTLINYEELANKYDVKYEKTETDSQIFCRIVYKVGFKVLSEYNGAGAFVFYDLVENSTYIFKGQSKLTEHSVEETEERPLFFIKNDKKKFIYFSSMLNSLNFINSYGLEPFTFTPNVLYKVINGEIVSRTKVDRSERFQTKSYSSYGYSNNRSYSNTSSYNNNTFIYIRDINKEEVSNLKDYLVFKKGRYYLNDELANGKFDINYIGFTKATYSSYSIGIINGIILEDVKRYDELIKDIDKLEESDILFEACKNQPWYSFKHNQFLEYDKDQNEEPGLFEFYGLFEPLFSKFKYTVPKNSKGFIKEGKYTETSITYNSEFAEKNKKFI